MHDGKHAVDDWFVQLMGQVIGPLSPADMLKMVAERKLTDADLVRKGTGGHWVAAASVHGLFNGAAAHGPAVATQPLPKGTLDPARRWHDSPAPTASAASPAPTLHAQPAPAAPAAMPAADDGIHVQRLAIGACALVGAISVGLPWMYAPITGGVPGTIGWGALCVLGFVPAIVLVFAGDLSAAVVGPLRIVAAAPAVGASSFGIWKLVECIKMIIKEGTAQPRGGAFGDLGASMSREMAKMMQPGIGLILVIAAGIAIAVAAFVLAHVDLLIGHRKGHAAR